MIRNSTARLGLALLIAIGAGCSRSPEAIRDRHMARGKQLLAEKEYARAIVEFRNAARAKPNEAEIYYQMGLATQAAGDIVAAAQAYHKAASLDPKHAGAQLKVAGLMSATGDRELLKEAEGRLRALLETTPVTAEILHTLALTELRMGRTEDAVQSLEQALAKAPQELNSSVMLSLAKLEQKDVAGAEEVLKKACEASPKSPEARIILARFYYSQSRPAEGEAEIRRALEIKPDYGPALMDLGRVYSGTGKKAEAEQIFKRLSGFETKTYRPVYALFLFQEGRREEAVKEFERLLKLDPEDRMARTRLVSAYGSLNRRPEAEKILAEALQKNPKDIEALLQRAELMVADGKHSQAEADINQVLRLKPDSGEVRYTLARLHLARGNAHSYRQEMTRALEINPYLLPVRLELSRALVGGNAAQAALDLLNQAPEAQKEMAAVVAQRNWALWALGQHEEMRKGIEQGLKRERAPELLIQDGVWKLRAGDIRNGRASLEEALKINPNDLRALAALNDTYVAEKKPGLAVQKVKEMAAAQPKSAPIQEFLGLLLLAHGDRPQARTAFTAAKAADPNYIRAEMSLAQLDAAENKVDDAMKRLKGLLASGQANSTAQLWLGNLEVVKGNQKAAMEHFRKVVEREPGNAQALNNLAYALLEYADRPEEALKYAEKAVELAPERPALADTLGWILYRRGVYGAAVTHLERAASHQNADAVSKYHLAMAYAKAGDPKRGRVTLEAALKINPNLPEAKMAQELLRQ
jgi:tetratricopeptide (TPR) repeat protein